MDIKEKIEEVVQKLTSDKDLLSEFKADPVKTLEDKLGVDLPDEQMKALVDGIKAKVDVEGFGEKVKEEFEEVKDKIEGLFHHEDAK